MCAKLYVPPDVFENFQVPWWKSGVNLTTGTGKSSADNENEMHYYHRIIVPFLFVKCQWNFFSFSVDKYFFMFIQISFLLSIFFRLHLVPCFWKVYFI